MKKRWALEISFLVRLLDSLAFGGCMQMCSKEWVVTRGIFYSAVVAEKTLSMPQGFF